MNKGIHGLLKTYYSKMQMFKNRADNIIDWLIANEAYFALKLAIIEMNEYDLYFDENGNIRKY